MEDYHGDNDVVNAYVMFVQAAKSLMKYNDIFLYQCNKLSMTQFMILQALASNGKSMAPSQIAEWTLTERNNITTLIDRMSRDGLITTTRNKKDKRYIDVSITPEGKKILDKTTKKSAQLVEQVMHSVKESEAPVIEKWCRLLRDNSFKGYRDLAESAASKYTRTGAPKKTRKSRVRASKSK